MALLSKSSRRRAKRRPFSCWLAALCVAAWPLGAPAAAVEDPLPLGVMKKLSVEELMDLEVTSVSRRPEKLLDAAAAIQVITQDEIRRAGASSLAEALRLATN